MQLFLYDTFQVVINIFYGLGFCDAFKMLSCYRRNPENLDTRKICCYHPKRIYHRVMGPNNADGMANSVDPFRNSLICVYTVCLDLSVQKLRIIKWGET